MGIKYVVADAGLLLPEAGTVGLDKFEVDLWVSHNFKEMVACGDMPRVSAEDRGKTVGAGLSNLQGQYPNLWKDEILFLVRRINFVDAFTAGAGTTCGEWTRPVNNKGQKGFFKANPSTGVCPVGCYFCYLRGVPYSSNAIALNVGEYAQQIARLRKVRGRSVLPKIVNLSETGGPIEWAVQYGLQKLIQTYTDATLAAGVIPYWLTKRAIDGVDFAGAHVGISLNPSRVMKAHSPFADHPTALLSFLKIAHRQGASTVIRWGPVMAGFESEYDDLAYQVNEMGFGTGRITVDLLRYSKRHPEMMARRIYHVGGGEVVGVDSITPVDAGFEFRAHKWQESAEVQRAHLERVRGYFPNAIIAGCKLDPMYAVEWVHEGIIQSFPCACWI
jgi:DNA repair photolyase